MGFSVRRYLLYLAVVSHILGGSAFVSSKMKLNGIWIQRVGVLLLLLFCTIHEFPSVTYWISDIRNLHLMLVVFQTTNHWLTLFTNIFLNWKENSKLNSALNKLESLHIDLDHKIRKKLSRLQIGHMFFNASLCFGFHYIGNELIWENINYTYLTTFIYFISEFILGFTTIIFVQLLLLLREYFREVNKNLMKMSSSASLFFINSETKYRSRLVELRQAHFKLISIGSKINECFSFQLVLTIILSSIEMTYSLKSMVSLLTGADSSRWLANPTLEVLLTTLWCGYFMLVLIQCVAACHTTTIESRATRKVIYKLMNQNRMRHCENELMIFSEQISRHRLSFNAGAVFALQPSLITSVIGAMITYLVMIVTFKE